VAGDVVVDLPGAGGVAVADGGGGVDGLVLLMPCSGSKGRSWAFHHAISSQFQGLSIIRAPASMYTLPISPSPSDSGGVR
jgi:hypothetical protein